jgi:hypothetical protein
MSKQQKEPAARLTKPVAFRLTEADHAAYLSKVEASGLKSSEYFRDCVLQNKTQVIARPRPSADYGRLVYLVNKASNNINQLAHRANADHQAGKVSEATYTGILADLNMLAHYLRAALNNAD